jgi:hypothetical protein
MNPLFTFESNEVDAVVFIPTPNQTSIQKGFKLTRHDLYRAAYFAWSDSGHNLAPTNSTAQRLP